MYGSSEAVLPHGTGQAHGRLVSSIASFLKPNFYVELGCWRGDTFSMVEPYCSEAIAVDKEESLRQHFVNLGLEKNFVCSDTIAYVRSLGEKKMDLCFIDSSHQENATIDEFMAVWPQMVENGIILMHDSYPPNKEHTEAGKCGGVYRAVDRLKSMFALDAEFVTLPSQYGLTIVRKNRGKQVLWA